MHRILVVSFLIALGGCVSPERVAIPPLPVEGGGVGYGDLLTRLRLHSNAANEAFFTDDYSGLGARARDIEQTAGYLPRASDAPKAVQPRLAEDAMKLAAEARTLDQAAQAKNEDTIRETLRKLHTLIRTMPANDVK